MVLNLQMLPEFLSDDINKFEVGKACVLKHLITQEDIDAFANLTGDFNPVHLDKNFAKRTQFGRPVVHGMLTSSYISTMIGMLLPGPGALWLSQTLEFMAPAFVGDEIVVNAVVKQISTASRILVLDITITNQLGNNIVSGQAKVKLLNLHETSNKEDMEKKEPVLITGASRGIGAATAKKLASLGYPVVINYLQNESAANLVANDIQDAGGIALLAMGDVSSMADVDKIFSNIESAIGYIKHIVHCAALNPEPQSFLEQAWPKQENDLNTQLKGAFNCVQRALPKMIESGTGSIVFLGSIFTEGVPPINQSSYVVTKAALTALGKTIAVEYGPRGIRVNIVAPGMTQTDMLTNVPEKTKMLAKMNTPLRRLAQPEEIAEVIAFLIGPSSRHITGVTLSVSGGLTM
ncbi:SDR family oxidoreductase [Polynucleobacter bastaniensis]|uniref:SDR family oxidoreductase n=1 Tax=Polynucleobacter bastaniensis TaxID=2081039 RepID=UPI001C0BF5FC|nr:SDR family oxidoreductase [Polynucleobacter bastaniensis]MBU3598259.1 SDR family oxidoreductase [Polynucleobacter bastaniensis]